MIEILKADKTHKEVVLKLLDDFVTACIQVIDPEKGFISTAAKESGSPVFDEVVDSTDGAIFLAKDENNYVGIVTVYKIPQIRKGRCCAEIEEMYVVDEFQGKNVAEKLVDAVIKWAKENSIKCVRLESSNELKRAHGFYEKAGFKFYAKAYEKIIE
ncbi:GNAT family N-acetyltransferase [Candidatus Aenigmatarchaeota archaeon]